MFSIVSVCLSSCPQEGGTITHDVLDLTVQELSKPQHQFPPREPSLYYDICWLLKNIWLASGQYTSYLKAFLLLNALSSELGFSELRKSVGIFFIHFPQIPLSGGSLNPARSLGPAIVANFWKSHWVRK